jgi:hypothetical protein
MRQVGTGGVAVKDLEDEQVDRPHRAEDAVAPAVAAIPAELAQRLGLEERGDVIPDLSQGIGQ